MDAQNTLVTGSSGTIGTRLCERLLDADDISVRGLDRRENRWLPAVEEITRRIDLLEPSQLSRLEPDIDTLVHLAANARVYELVQDPDLAKENVDTIYTILEYARTNDIPRLIFASSREVYGDTTGAEPTAERAIDVADSESPYSSSKMGGESLVHAYSNCYGLDTTIIRYSNVYGMYDASDRVIPLFIKQSLDGQDLEVYGEEKLLDFTYIDDAVDGTIRAIRQADAARNETFNIASGEGTSLITLAEHIRDELDAGNDIHVGESRTGEVMKFIADISKAEDALGYSPTTGIAEGLRKTVDWYRNNLYTT